MRCRPIQPSPAKPDARRHSSHRTQAFTKPSGLSRAASSASPRRSSGKAWVTSARGSSRPGPHRLHRLAQAAPIGLGRAFVGVHHVDPAPVPLLHVHLPRPVLVVARDHQPPAFGHKVPARSSAGWLPTASITTSHSGPTSARAHPTARRRGRPPSKVRAAPMRRARHAGAFAAGEREDLGPLPRREPGQRGAEEPDAHHRHPVARHDGAAAEDVHRAGEGLARERQPVEFGRQPHGIGRGHDLVARVARLAQDRDPVAPARSTTRAPTASTTPQPSWPRPPGAVGNSIHSGPAQGRGSTRRRRNLRDARAPRPGPGRAAAGRRHRPARGRGRARRAGGPCGGRSAWRSGRRGGSRLSPFRFETRPSRAPETADGRRFRKKRASDGPQRLGPPAGTIPRAPFSGDAFFIFS
jgi:hypothetical protein